MRENSKNLEDTMSRGKNWTDSLTVFAVGLGVGAAVAVLLAPRSGAETRESLLRSAKDGLNDVVAVGEKLTRRAQAEIEYAKDQVRQATEVGERAYREAMNTPS
jgi:gas vesicle protein